MDSCMYTSLSQASDSIKASPSRMNPRVKSLSPYLQRMVSPPNILLWSSPFRELETKEEDFELWNSLEMLKSNVDFLEMLECLHAASVET